jgi:hypothetical protein
MNAAKQIEVEHNRYVRSRAFAALLLLAAVWSLYLRLRHLSQRLKVPHNYLIAPPLLGSAGRVLDLSTYVAMAALAICLVTETRDRLDRVLLVACFAPVVIDPLKMLLPAYAASIWWVELGCTLVFTLAAVAVFLRLSQSDSANDTDQIP